jgi:hypothetical protein
MYNKTHNSNRDHSSERRKLYATLIQVDKQQRIGLNMIPFLIRTGMIALTERKN